MPTNPPGLSFSFGQGPPRAILKVASVFPVILGIAIILWSYYAFVGHLCRLLVRDHLKQSIGYLVVYHGLFIMFVWCYLRCIITNPGNPRFRASDSEVDPEVPGPEGEGEGEGESESEPTYSPRRDEPRRIKPDPAEAVGEEGLVHYPTGSDATMTPPLVNSASSSAVHLPLTAGSPPRTMAPVPRLLSPALTDSPRRSSPTSGGLSGPDFYCMSSTAPLAPVTVKFNGTKRYCRKCNMPKPDRAHHCSVCQVCVLKMDHHCPWINNCVGHGNHKVFILFLFWGCLYCWFCFAATLPTFIELLLSKAMDRDPDIHLLFLMLAAGIFGISLSVFIGFHTYLLIRNVTTIETYEKNRFHTEIRPESPLVRYHNLFNMGVNHNFQDVMGPRWHLWIFPIINSRGDGHSFPINTYVYGSFPLEEGRPDFSTSPE